MVTVSKKDRDQRRVFYHSSWKRTSHEFIHKQVKGYEVHTRCGSLPIQRWQQIVRITSENLETTTKNPWRGRTRQGKRLTLKTKTNSRTTKGREVWPVVVKLKKKGFSDWGKITTYIVPKSHVSPPHSDSIIYNGTGSLMFTPPPPHPFFTHCHLCRVCCLLLINKVKVK